MDNIDQLKSSSPSDEDQMDMMMAMMMMQLPEFSASYSDSTTAEAFPPQPEFHSTAITMRLSDSIDNPPTMQWSSFTDHQLPSNSSTAISFSNNSSSTAQLLLQRQGQATCSASLSANRLGKTSTEEGANPCGGRRENSESNNSKNKRNKSMAAMREMIFRIAAMQPINIDPESVKAPKRRNVKISKDPQSVAARHRRERISERIRILQRLVPGGTKMDTASMLDEAIHYVKFLKTHLHSLQQRAAANTNHNNNHSVAAAAADIGIGFPVPISMPTRTSAASNYHLSMPKLYQAPNLEQ